MLRQASSPPLYRIGAPEAGALTLDLRDDQLTKKEKNKQGKKGRKEERTKDGNKEGKKEKQRERERENTRKKAKERTFYTCCKNTCAPPTTVKHGSLFFLSVDVLVFIR